VNPLVPALDRIVRLDPFVATLVSLIVPTRNQHEVLGSLHLPAYWTVRTTNKIEIIIVDTRATIASRLNFLQRCVQMSESNHSSDRPIQIFGMNNKAVQQHVARCSLIK